MSMMRTTLIVLALAGCTKVPGTESVDDPGRGNQGVIAPKPTGATITLMSVTFGDDCGGTAPAMAPPAPAPAPMKRKISPAEESMPAQDSASPTAYAYRCEQTSMQLSIAAKSDASVKIKSVEVFDEKGASLGTLSTSKPTRWSDKSSVYEAWDETVAADQVASVSYVLSQPTFVNRWDSHDRMYTVKVTASIGGIEQSMQSTVMVVAQPAPMPT